jgi:hypothetical protein
VVVVMVVVVMVMAAAIITMIIILGDLHAVQRLGIRLLRARGVVGSQQRDGIWDRRKQVAIRGRLQRLGRIGNGMGCSLRGTQRRQPGDRAEQSGDPLIHMVPPNIAAGARVAALACSVKREQQFRGSDPYCVLRRRPHISHWPLLSV